jgi:hypothetical protein
MSNSAVHLPTLYRHQTATEKADTILRPGCATIYTHFLRFRKDENELLLRSTSRNDLEKAIPETDYKSDVN